METKKVTGRETETERERHTSTCVCKYIHVCKYIYINIKYRKWFYLIIT